MNVVSWLQNGKLHFPKFIPGSACAVFQIQIETSRDDSTDHISDMKVHTVHFQLMSKQQ